MSNFTIFKSAGIIAALTLTSMAEDTEAFQYMIRETNYFYDAEGNFASSYIDWQNIEAIGSKLSENDVHGLGSSFELHCILKDNYTIVEGSDAIAWHLDTAFVSADSTVSAKVIIDSPDPYSTDSEPYRTRADKGYSVSINTYGLIPSTVEGAQPSQTKVIYLHEYTLAQDSSTLYELSSGLLDYDDTYSNSYSRTNIPQSDVSANGSETVAVYAIPEKYNGNNGHGNNIDGVDSSNNGNSKDGEDTDPSTDDEIIKGVLANLIDNASEEPDRLLSQETVRIYPQPTASLSGITQNQVIGADMPDITMSFNNLYPGSDTYLVIYKANESVPELSDERTRFALTVQSHRTPLTQTNTYTKLSYALDSQGIWKAEIRHDSPFGDGELLDSVQFEVLPTVKVNADINTVK